MRFERFLPESFARNSVTYMCMYMCMYISRYMCMYMYMCIYVYLYLTFWKSKVFIIWNAFILFIRWHLFLGLSNKAFNESGDLLNGRNGGCGYRGPFLSSESKGHTSCFTNSYLTEKTLWSEQSKLYGHGNEVFCVTTYDSNDLKLIASSCKVSFSKF